LRVERRLYDRQNLMLHGSPMTEEHYSQYKLIATRTRAMFGPEKGFGTPQQ
jgi:hypothetical protein